jgi:hypothetical protein
MMKQKIGKALMAIGMFFGAAFALSLGLLGATMAVGLVATIGHPGIPTLPDWVLPWMGIILGCELAGACFFGLGICLSGF